MRRALAFLLLGPAAILSAQTRTFRPITVQQKVALVVGNASYARAPLVNPVRDAQAVAAELRALGFTVLTGNNLSLRELSRQIDDFAGRVHSGDLALFYFSGHGMQVDRENYLLPIDFEAAADADVPYTAYPASRVRDKLEGAGARLRILILDACRDNPYKTSRGGPSGLAPMGTNAEGTLIAFATGDNNVASDGPGQSNGLFTGHLLAALREPGLELHDLFKRVKEDVYYGSDKKQNPFTYDDVAGSFYFRPPADIGGVTKPAPAPAADVDAWEAIRSSNDSNLFEQFLKEYPTSQYAGAARLKLAALKPPDSAPALRDPKADEKIANGFRAGETRVNPKDGLTSVWIPPGTFMLGCSAGDSSCNDSEKPAHKVTITKGFWMDQEPVTQEVYQRLTGTNPSHFTGAKLPVENVKWDEAQSYCQTVGMRLPTEAEWEYAARAGTTRNYYGDLNAIAWYDANSAKMTHEVGQKRPNAWGLYDMLGNVSQWTSDWFAKQLPEASVDPVGPPTGKYHAFRGGTWHDSAGQLRVSDRGYLTDLSFVVSVGIRCANN